jgi:hypothetical protein
MNNKPAIIPPNRIKDAARSRYATADQQQPIAVQALQRQAFQEGAKFAIAEMEKMGAMPATACFLQ